MYREIITPTNQKHTIEIPKEYLNKEVEILILPFSYVSKKKNLKITDPMIELQIPSMKETWDNEDKPTYKDLGISEETHRKLLALKPKNSTEAKKMSQFREDISKKLDKNYAGKSINEIRDEYFISKGYM